MGSAPATGNASRRPKRPIGAAVTLVLSLIFASMFGLYALSDMQERADWDRARAGVQVQGDVVATSFTTKDCRRNPFCEQSITFTRVTVRYRLDGRTRTATVDVKGALYKSNTSSVQVWVDPNRPDHIAIEGRTPRAAAQPWARPTLAAISAIVAIISGWLLISPTRRRKRREAATAPLLTPSSPSPPTHFVPLPYGSGNPVVVRTRIPFLIEILWWVGTLSSGFFAAAAVLSGGSEGALAGMMTALMVVAFISLLFPVIAWSRWTWNGTALRRGRNEIEPNRVVRVAVGGARTGPVYFGGGIVAVIAYPLAVLLDHLLQRRSQRRGFDTGAYTLFLDDRKHIVLPAAVLDLKQLQDFFARIPAAAWDSDALERIRAILNEPERTETLLSRSLSRLPTRWSWIIAALFTAATLATGFAFNATKKDYSSIRESGAARVIAAALDPYLAPAGGIVLIAQTCPVFGEMASADGQIDPTLKSCKVVVAYDDGTSEEFVASVERNGDSFRFRSFDRFRADSATMGTGTIWWSGRAAQHLLANQGVTACWGRPALVAPGTVQKNACTNASRYFDVRIDGPGTYVIVTTDRGGQ
ncbi:MAG: hypothetical protein ACOYN3_10410 [Acidimicrobiia bacterium]